METISSFVMNAADVSILQGCTSLRAVFGLRRSKYIMPPAENVAIHVYLVPVTIATVYICSLHTGCCVS